MIYQWKSGSRIKADAQASGELMEKLSASEEGLTAQTLLDANRAENAPLHSEYEWNDTTAAEKYRLHQSGHFLRCILAVEIQQEEQSEEPADEDGNLIPVGTVGNAATYDNADDYPNYCAMMLAERRMSIER